MTIALIALAAVLALSYLPTFWLILRHLNARDALERDERARDARERDVVQVRHAQQITELLQRIQAPQMAVMQHQIDQAGPDETLPLSDEESAEAAERQLVIERIERMEREGVLSEALA